MSLAPYRDIIAASRGAFVPTGFDGDFDLPSSLFPHQKAAVEFSLRAGTSAMFLDTGLGKTRSALAWGQEVVSRTNRPVLMLALTALRHSMVGKPVRITFGRYNQQRGVVLDVFPKDAVRPQDMALIKLNDGRIVSGVPVKDLEVCG